MDSVGRTLRQKQVVSVMKILQQSDCLFRMQSRVLLATLKLNVLEYALKKCFGFNLRPFNIHFHAAKVVLLAPQQHLE